jgi:hypothetical protein
MEVLTLLLMLLLLGVMALPLIAIVRTVSHPLPRLRHHRRRTA